MPRLRFPAVARAASLAALTLLAAAAVHAAERYWPPIVDPATNQHNPGRWVWADLVTSDVAAAAQFYGQVFGWTFETYGGKDDRDTYTLALANGLPIGGMVFDRRASNGKVGAARWIGLVSVPDVKATAEAVTRNGGRIVYAPQMLGQRGETAVFADTEGTLFGAVNSKHGDPLDFAGELGEWVWLDLWTADVEKATQFYRSVIGYETQPVATNGENATRNGGVYLMAEGLLRAGIMPRQDPKASSVWLPYVRVANVAQTAARAQAAGGKVLIAPTPVGEASVAVIADPTGAPVGIAQLPAVEKR
jgi:predicted enzyme related to lactoylglutathione lyase